MLLQSLTTTPLQRFIIFVVLSLASFLATPAQTAYFNFMILKIFETWTLQHRCPKYTSCGKKCETNSQTWLCGIQNGPGKISCPALTFLNWNEQKLQIYVYQYGYIWNMKPVAPVTNPSNCHTFQPFSTKYKLHPKTALTCSSTQTASVLDFQRTQRP